MLTVKVEINGEVLMEASAVHFGEDQKGIAQYRTNDNRVIEHNPSDGAKALAIKLLNLCKEPCNHQYRVGKGTCLWCGHYNPKFDFNPDSKGFKDKCNDMCKKDMHIFVTGSDCCINCGKRASERTREVKENDRASIKRKECNRKD